MNELTTKADGRWRKRLNLKGKRFGRLAVVEITEDRDGDGSVVWLCKCACGKELKVPAKSLTRANTRSCGCLKKEKFTNRTHGQSQTTLYDVWDAMLQRCYNPRNKKYADYGGRGIGVHDSWRHDFKAFHDWAIANGYEYRLGKHRLSIDRRDNNKGYSPDNCRWATYSEQNFNQRPRRR